MSAADVQLSVGGCGLIRHREVERVELSVEDGRVDVWVVHPSRTRFSCPDCERELAEPP